MIVNVFFLLSNPFFNAYTESDFLGRSIFISLILLSVITWVLLIHKVWLMYLVKKNSDQMKRLISGKKANILDYDISSKNMELNPFLNVYQVLKKQSIDILNKNRHFIGSSDKAPHLSPSDIEVVESHLVMTIAIQIKFLEKNLFVLSTIVSLAPFLGLLGTVWGILTTFSELQAATGGNTNQMVIGGLSLALATTVLGLVDAVPALIGYNYLKHSVSNFQTDMECFSNEILVNLEMQYRKVDVV